MATPVIQHAFHSGEWNPALFARVDLQKYKAGAARLRNFYVDYRGGASTRPGTRFCNRCFKSGSPVRNIPFQPTSTTSYVLEFGDGYIRFFSNGNPILETAITVTGTSGNSITTAGNAYAIGDWVFIGGQYYIVLTTGATFTVTDLWGNSSVTPTGTTVARVYTIASPFGASDLFPNPRTGNPGIKYAQAVQTMIICHPSYQPQVLTINAPNNWTINTISFGPTVNPPTISSLTTNLAVLASGWNYGYVVTAVDANGQESAASTMSTLIGFQNLATQNSSNTTGATNVLSWGAVTGAVSYNVYKASALFNTAFPTGTPVGFIANTKALTFADASPGIGPDFSQTPPILQNPFLGPGVNNYVVTATGAPYTVVPSVSVAGPSLPGGTPATAGASLGVTSFSSVTLGSINTTGANPINTLILFPNGVTATITGTSFIGTFNSGGFTIFAWNITSFVLNNPGSITGVGATTPSNPVTATGYTVSGLWSVASYSTANMTWGVTQVIPLQAGSGYSSAPAVTFGAGGATATAVLTASGVGFPGVPGFLQERLALAATSLSPMTFELSQPATFYNFNTNDPVEPDDAISGTIFSGELNDIKSLTPVPTGLLVLSGKLAWIVNGGGGLSAYNPITPANAVANPQAFSGANDLPPLKINQDILYGTNKGSYIRDLNYNIYANVFTGTDISVISSHLFFNHYITQWAWAEEPFKTAWCIRDDGVMLSLAYVKDQDTIGWGRHDTNGQFMSVATVIETTASGNTVDAVYVVVKRVINNQVVQYMERLTDRYFTYGYEDSWSVDAGLQTVPQVNNQSTLVNFAGDASAVGNVVTLIDNSASGPFTLTMATNNWIVRAGGGIYKITAFTSANQVTATVQRVPTLLNPYTNLPFVPASYTIWQPVTTVSGLSHLIGQSVTGVADGTVITGTVTAGGTFSLGLTATKVTLGLGFTPQLQTLPIDLGTMPTVQGRPKVITAVAVRCADTLGLSIGTKFTTLVPMKDTTLGNLNYYLNATVSDLLNGDSRTQIDSTWAIPGQYCIQQSSPYPATILGVIPEFSAEARP